MAVAIVTRKSTRDEAKVSVTRQEEWGRKWAAEHHPGVEVLVFSDNATSGTDMQRAGWLAFVDAVRAGTVDVVWAWEQSRLTRAGEAAWHDVCVLLSTAGIGHVDTHRQGAISVVEGDRLHGGINSVIDQHQREVARVNTIDGLAHLAQQGRPAGATGYGYRRTYGDDGRPILVPDPNQAEHVRAMVEAIADGASLGVVAADLTARRIPTPRGGQRWNRDTVRTIVTAPRIVGQRVHQGRVIGGAQWEPIVDRLTWERARARLATHQPGRTADQRRRYLLTGGLAICDECTTPLISGTTPIRGQRHPSYQCPHPSRADGGCGHCSILADRLERHVIDTVAGWLDDPTILQALNGTDPEPPPVDELNAVEAQLADLAEQLARGDLLPVEHQAARAVLVDRHRALSTRIAAPPSQPLTVDDLLIGWRADDVADRREVLRHLAEPIRVASAFRDGHRLTLGERVHVTPRWA